MEFKKPLLFNNILVDHYYTINANLILDASYLLLASISNLKPSGILKGIFVPAAKNLI